MVFLLWFFNMTALIYAAQYGYYDIFEILLKHPKINCTISDEKGRNALYYASHEGMTKIVELILKSNKFDINKEEFKLLSNINYAANLSQKDLRSLIINLVGDVSDEEIFEENNIGVKVNLVDERLTTVEATNYLLEQDVSRKKRKKVVDGVAASIILDTFLKMKGD